MIIEPAQPEDAEGIAVVHVLAWRSAYANLLPSHYLAAMSVARHRAMHRQAIATGHNVLVARAADQGKIVGFCSMGRPRTRLRAGPLADGEIETLYVLDEWREQGFGRALLQGAAMTLAAKGCRSAFLWVLQDNPSRWFYERLRGKAIATSPTQVAGQTFIQTAYVWDPITLLTASDHP